MAQGARGDFCLCSIPGRKFFLSFSSPWGNLCAPAENCTWLWVEIGLNWSSCYFQFSHTHTYHMTKGLFWKSPFRDDAENGLEEFSARLCDVSAKILSLTNTSPAHLSTAASIKSDHIYTHHDFLPSAQQEKAHHHWGMWILGPLTLFEIKCGRPWLKRDDLS